MERGREKEKERRGRTKQNGAELFSRHPMIGSSKNFY